MEENPAVALEISEIRDILKAKLITGSEHISQKVTGIYASDLMSDVLAFGKSGSILLTGLNTIQAVISSYMAEFKAIIFIRGKKPGQDMQEFAAGKQLVILSTDADMFEACVQIAKLNNNLPDTMKRPPLSTPDENVSLHRFEIDGRDFANAGMVSTKIKSIIKTIGYDPKLVRRVAIAMYEGEMNVVMHAIRAKVTLTAGDSKITVVIDDEGKGIPDVQLAMQEGFSTATEEQRALGFGSGMGLPNINRNADDLIVTSEVDVGTRIEMRFNVT